jgi:hypothetical protein
MELPAGRIWSFLHSRALGEMIARIMLVVSMPWTFGLKRRTSAERILLRRLESSDEMGRSDG